MSIYSIFAGLISGADVGLSGTQVADSTTAWNSLLNTVYSIAGIVAVLVIIVAGIYYATSNGDAGNIQRAKNAILYSVIGIIVIIMAFTITQFVIGRAAG